MSTSPLASLSWMNGEAARSRNPVAGSRTTSGRRMTQFAHQLQKPTLIVPAGRRDLKTGSRRRLTAGPSIDIRAGRNVSAYTTATATTIAPAAPIEARKVPWKKSIAERPTATVMPENVIARPAVAIVVASASSRDAPFASSSRKRLTTNSE